MKMQSFVFLIGLCTDGHQKTFAFSFEFLLWRLTNFLPFNKFIQKYRPCKRMKLGVTFANVFQTPSLKVW